jgi:hypothetical protein
VDKKKLPCAGLREGFEATVTAVKAHEAILKRQRMEYDPSWYQIG